MVGKRKLQETDDIDLCLSLSIPLPLQTPSVPPPPPPPPPRPYRTPTHRHARQTPNQTNTIVPPYQWATNQPCHVHTLDHLSTNSILTISGETQCKKCNAKQTNNLDLLTKFRDISSYIIKNKPTMHDRAPAAWMNPTTRCEKCGGVMRPVMPENKDDINWLFLLLNQMLGFCSLEQLKYFCMCTGNHRTGAKDRVLYLTYLALCKQLDPKGPFDV